MGKGAGYRKERIAISIGRLDRCVMTRRRERERLYCGTGYGQFLA